MKLHLLLVAVMVMLGNVCQGQGPVITLSSDQPEARIVVSLAGADHQELARLSPSELAQCLRLYVKSNYRNGAGQAVLAEVVLSENRLTLHPRFALERGLEYLVQYRRPGAEAFGNHTFTLSKPELKPTTTVRQVYPTAEVLPQNLLKFYIHFSAPMSQGNVYQYISLTNEAGQTLVSPFLEVEQELWDTTGQRLTLLLDPGRIKRGLVPREEDGPILANGQRYRLTIDARWPDANGVPLATGYVKKFLVGPDDYTQPNPAHWKIKPPKSRTLEPLTIEMIEPVDHATFARGLIIENSKGEVVRGVISFSDHETRASFQPLKPWRAGLFDACFGVLIEDLAGNSIDRPFEVDRFDEVVQPTQARKRLTFEIQ